MIEEMVTFEQNSRVDVYWNQKLKQKSIIGLQYSAVWNIKVKFLTFKRLWNLGLKLV